MSDAAARPNVSVFDAAAGEKVVGNVPLPVVLTAPIRVDVVNETHTAVNKNKRQAYCVYEFSGMQTAAESWGTGRAVSRIPRVPGGGTHRSGQGAFGNMCRGGRMFNPTRIWRKWHRKCAVNKRRYAISSALAASAVPGLVMARGHRVSEVPELPLVVGGEGLGQISKTKDALALLKRFGCGEDLERVSASKRVRAGQGKMRNRRYVKKRGPLVIHACDSAVLPRALRNIEGVDLCHVDRLNILQLAPGGHVGRFVVWTEDAFKRLDSLYGTQVTGSSEKKGFHLPRPICTNADISRIINSDEIQKVVRPARVLRTKTLRKKNPLTNIGVMVKLNPYVMAQRRAEIKAQKQRAERKSKAKTKRETNAKSARRAFYEAMIKD